MVIGGILAAGRSTRMGRPKALLARPPTGEPFIVHLVGVLRRGGVETVMAVVREDDDPLRAALAGMAAPPQSVFNPDPDRGHLSSLLCAVDAAEQAGADALLVTPVDMPLTRAETVASLVRAFTQCGAPITRAVYRGRHGHPVIFSRRVFDDLRHADPAVGARSVVRACGPRVLDVEVDDAGVLVDVDDPSAYRTAFGTEPA
jgi:molybdenum cofactor cytidylyltransferase